MAGAVIIEVDQGVDFACQLVWTNEFDEPMTVQAPCRMDVVDSTGATVLTLETPVDPVPPGDIAPITLSEDMGLIQLFIPRATTAALPPGSYGYDLFVSIDDGGQYAGFQVERLIGGIFQVNKRFTKMAG